MAANDPTPGAVTGERSNHKTAGIFSTTAEATQAGTTLRNQLGLGEAQVQVLHPGDGMAAKKLQPESHGIFRTMMKAHFKLGILGAIAGGVVFAVLAYVMKIEMFLLSPALAAAMFIIFGAIAGLMLGGLVTLRPDQDAYIRSVYEAIGEGRAAVVVHAFDAEQRDAAESALKGMTREVISTL